MGGQAHEHEVACLQHRAGGDGTREPLQPGRRESPDGEPGGGERVVDQPRAVEPALRAALATPHVRPAELRERPPRRQPRRRQGRARRRRGTPPTGGTRQTRRPPWRSRRAGRRPAHAHRQRRGVVPARARTRWTRASVRAGPLRARQPRAPPPAWRGPRAATRRRRRHRRTAGRVRVAAASATASAEPCTRSSSTRLLARSQAGACDQREQRAAAPPLRSRPRLAQRADSRRKSPAEVNPRELRQRQAQAARHVELEYAGTQPTRACPQARRLARRRAPAGRARRQPARGPPHARRRARPGTRARAARRRAPRARAPAPARPARLRPARPRGGSPLHRADRQRRHGQHARDARA